MITVKTSDVISYIKNHISKEEYDNAHRIDVVITILGCKAVESELIADQLDSLFCFHDDFWDYDGVKGNKTDIQRYLSEYSKASTSGDHCRYTIWWRIR